MILCDVNVLIYAFREDSPDHEKYYAWLVRQISSPRAYGVCDLVLSGFLRIVTHSKVFSPPTPLTKALEFTNYIREQENAVSIEAGERHWTIFSQLCTESQAKGNLIPDAYFAALAIEHACTWITTDRDYSRFPQLRWKHPLHDKDI